MYTFRLFFQVEIGPFALSCLDFAGLGMADDVEKFLCDDEEFVSQTLLEVDSILEEDSSNDDLTLNAQPSWCLEKKNEKQRIRSINV